MYDDDTFEQDLSRTRTKQVNGREYTVQCTDPYGLWHIKGNVAECLKGQYTGAEQAWQAINAYEAARPVPQEKTIMSTDGKGNKKRIPQDSTLASKE